MEKSPPVDIVEAIWKRMEKRINATASSKATTGNKVFTNGPRALYCLMTINVAAGAVALAIADNTKTNSKEINDGKTKWRANSPPITKIEAPKASKMVIITTLLPSDFKIEALKELPIEKAIKPRATLLTHLI